MPCLVSSLFRPLKMTRVVQVNVEFEKAPRKVQKNGLVLKMHLQFAVKPATMIKRRSLTGELAFSPVSPLQYCFYLVQQLIFCFRKTRIFINTPKTTGDVVPVLSASSSKHQTEPTEKPFGNDTEILLQQQTKKKKTISRHLRLVQRHWFLGRRNNLIAFLKAIIDILIYQHQCHDTKAVDLCKSL